MNLVDLAIVLALILAVVRGYRRGLSYSVLSLLGLLVGLTLGSWAATAIPPQLQGVSSALQNVIAVALVLALAFLGDAVGALLGARLRMTTLRSRLGGRVDSVAGVAWGVVVTLAISWYLGLIFAAGPFQPLSEQIQGSTILRTLSSSLPAGPSWLGDLQHILGAAPFPQVFATLVPPLPGPVALPGDLSGNTAVRQAAQETVKVVSQGCGGEIEGSGFPVDPNVIATNAHVVAGGHGTVVLVPGRSAPLPAEVVYFNPKVDLALLRVPGLALPPLSFATSSPRGTQGAVVGYPGGGVEQVVPGAVRGTVQAVGRDIYSNVLVSRQILVLQAVVIPGNSGGPFVNLDGRVLGIVFAKSLVTSDEGYALSATEVEPSVENNLGDTQPVSTESCVLS